MLSNGIIIISTRQNRLGMYQNRAFYRYRYRPIRNRGRRWSIRRLFDFRSRPKSEIKLVGDRGPTFEPDERKHRFEIPARRTRRKETRLKVKENRCSRAFVSVFIVGRHTYFYSFVESYYPRFLKNDFFLYTILDLLGGKDSGCGRDRTPTRQMQLTRRQ